MWTARLAVDVAVPKDCLWQEGETDMSDDDKDKVDTPMDAHDRQGGFDNDEALRNPGETADTAKLNLRDIGASESIDAHAAQSAGTSRQSTGESSDTNADAYPKSSSTGDKDRIHARRRRTLHGILLPLVIAAVVIVVMAFASCELGLVGSDWKGASHAGNGVTATNGTTKDANNGNAAGSNAADVTVVSNGSCDSGNGSSNANGCDGKSDGTHGYDMLDAKQAAVLSEVDTDTVLDGISGHRTFVALFGYSSCPDCRAAVPLLIDDALGHGVKQILYVDTRKDPSWKSNMDITDYDRLVKVMGDRFSKDEGGKAHMQVPFVAFVRDGKIVASVEGDNGYSKATNNVDEDSTSQGLVMKYDDGFDKLLQTR